MLAETEQRGAADAASALLQVQDTLTAAQLRLLGSQPQLSSQQAAVLATLVKGISITVMVTLIAYGSACVIGLALALAGLSRKASWKWLKLGRSGTSAQVLPGCLIRWLQGQ